MRKHQWVCKVCGYNMVGKCPDVCPFCGVSHEHFATWQEIEAQHKVTAVRVNAYVSQLMSVPRLGYEHAAYRVESDAGAVWIDCPSAFNRDLEPVDCIYFTHPDFMGASNQYRKLWGSRVHLHALDAQNPLVRDFPVDSAFDGDFQDHGLQAFHVGGHTPGFTIYSYRDVVFVCDYVFVAEGEDAMRFNTYGDAVIIKRQARRILEVTAGLDLSTVCGWNYVTGYAGWRSALEALA